MDVVTGSFGYIGKYIANELLNKGREVKTITTHPNKPNPFGDKVQATTYNFDDPDKLIATLSGCDSQQHMKKQFKILMFVALGLVPIFMIGLMSWIFSPKIPEGSEILPKKVIIEKKNPNKEITAQILEGEKIGCVHSN
jgi:hypothetical protein